MLSMALQPFSKIATIIDMLVDSVAVMDIMSYQSSSFASRSLQVVEDVEDGQGSQCNSAAIRHHPCATIRQAQSSPRALSPPCERRHAVVSEKDGSAIAADVR